jgi:hypothetical protein
MKNQLQPLVECAIRGHGLEHEPCGKCGRCIYCEPNCEIKTTKPLFTAKHYEAIGKSLAVEAVNELPQSTYSLKEMVNWLSEFFKADNPKFNEKEFWKVIYYDN